MTALQHLEDAQHRVGGVAVINHAITGSTQYNVRSLFDRPTKLHEYPPVGGSYPRAEGLGKSRDLHRQIVLPGIGEAHQLRQPFGFGVGAAQIGQGQAAQILLFQYLFPGCAENLHAGQEHHALAAGSPGVLQQGFCAARDGINRLHRLCNEESRLGGGGTMKDIVCPEALPPDLCKLCFRNVQSRIVSVKGRCLLFGTHRQQNGDIVPIDPVPLQQGLGQQAPKKPGAAGNQHPLISEKAPIDHGGIRHGADILPIASCHNPFPF